MEETKGGGGRGSRGGRGGRGKATGRGRGRGAKAGAATDLATPSPKAVRAKCPEKGKELQTPEKPSKPRKSSDKPKPSKVAKADAEKHSKPSKAAKADAEKPSKAKKAKEAEPVTSADVAKDGDGKRKRRRFENFEDKSFARRTRPQGEYTGLQWQAIRDVFFEKLNTQFSAPSFHQDGYNIHA